MINKIITLFKIARKLAQSDAIKIIAKFHEPPKIIKIFSYLLSFSFYGSNKLLDKNCPSLIKVVPISWIELHSFCSSIRFLFTNLFEPDKEKDNR